MLSKRFPFGKQRFVYTLLALLLISVPGMAKAYFNFNLNPEYTTWYSEDWFRPDPAATKFHVVPIVEQESNDPPNVQVRSYELTDPEAKLPDSLFIKLQMENHIRYLDDNLNFDYTIEPPTLLEVQGANLAFHISTLLPGDPDAILITDYARKGKRMYIFRFFCPLPLYEKYLTDYILMRDGFSLK